MNTLSNSSNSQNWEETIANSGYTFSEVEKYMQESYQKGYDDKDVEIRNKIVEIFNANQDVTNKITEDLFQYLNSINITPITAFMKIESIFNFAVIVTVSLDDYISDNILKAYTWTNEAEKTSRNANYNLDLSFMYQDENLNVNCLNSDGFRFKHKALSGK